MLMAKDNNTSMYHGQYPNVFDSTNTKMYRQIMTTLRENLDKEMKRRGWTSYDMEDKSGVPQPTTSRFLNGKIGEPRATTVRKWAAALNMSEGELRGFDVDGKSGDSEQENLAANRELTAANIIDVPEVKGQVPLFSFAQVGDWGEADFNLPPTNGYKMVDTKVDVKERTFAIMVSGDSMEPEFSANGDVVIVEPDMPHKDGSYVLAKKGNDVFIRRVSNEGGDWLLKPCNKDYKPKPIEEYLIIGVIREKTKFYE